MCSRCQIASLKILKDISQSKPISRSLTDLGAIQSLIGLLSSTVPDLQCLAAETIANIAKLTRARRLVRKDGGESLFEGSMSTHVKLVLYQVWAKALCNTCDSYHLLSGISKFVSLLEIPQDINMADLKDNPKSVELLRCAALGLCSLSKSKKNKRVSQIYIILLMLGLI